MGGAWRLRGYVVENLLGQGSSSQVWRARVAATGEKVALKRLVLRDDVQLRRAHAEAAKLSVLEHPHLVRLHALVPDDDAAVLVLDLAERGSLAELLAARGRLTPGEVITAIAPVAAALAYVHQAGVVHGDVTPANVLFTAGGNALLADLGVARLTGEDCDAESTPAYIDPTVAHGGVPAPSSDVFMLAASALHALTGAPPWPGSDVEEVLDRARAGTGAELVARLRESGVPLPMAQVLRRVLDPDPARRGSAASFALDLRHSGVPVAVELAAGRPRREPVASAVVPPAPTETRPRGGRHAAAPPSKAPRRSGARSAVPVQAGPAEPAHRLPAGPAEPARPVRADPARPAFARPAASGSGGDPGPIVVPGAPPPTHRVVPRPRPTIPRPRRRRGPPIVAVIASAVVLAAAIAWGGLLLLHRGGDPAVAEPPLRAASTRASRSAVAPAPVKPTPTPTPTATLQPAATAPPTRSAQVDWQARLVALDTLRSRAFAERRPALLAQVYASPSLLAADTALLERIVPTGCVLLGARTGFSELAVTTRAGSAVLSARATLPPTRLMCGGVQRGRAAAVGPVELRLTLAGPVSSARISSQRTVT